MAVTFSPIPLPKLVPLVQSTVIRDMLLPHFKTLPRDVGMGYTFVCQVAEGVSNGLHETE